MQMPSWTLRGVAFLAVLSGGVSASAVAQSPASVSFGTSYQTIRGFGGSTAWLPALTDTQANALFSNATSTQIGLSILRVRIDPGGSANWGTELGNAQKASARGAVSIATPWTPPASMKSNASTVGGTLLSSQYANYASFLESFVTYMKNGGISLYGISMQNEPDANVTYESCSWTGATMDTWVKNNSSVLTTKLIMPESESFVTSLSDPTLNDASAVGHVGLVAGHIYGVAPAYYTNAEQKGKEVWMTEHYIESSGITGAIALAKEIHDSMTVGQYNAYLYWWLLDESSDSYPYGLVDASNNVKPAGYAMEQFARFVRPGYVRAGATANPTTNVYVSAYKGSGHYVIVAINTGSSSVNQTFDLSGATLSAMTAYRTSSTQSAASLGSVAVSNSAFTYALPGQSITTFVY